MYTVEKIDSKTKAMTPDEIKTQMIKMIHDETGLTLNQAINKTKITNKYGTKSGKMDFSTFSLVYVGNPNFSQGIKNGYGAGWYFKAFFVPGCGPKYIKIKNQML